MPISVTCSCGKTFAAPDNLAGKRVKCPQCGKPLDIPHPTSSSQQARSRKSKTTKSKTTKPSNDDVGDLLDEVDLDASTTGHRCPICRTDLDPDAILCVKCGYNFETGKKIKTKSSRKAAPVVRKNAPAKPPKTGIASKINSQVLLLIALLVALPIIAYVVLSRMPAS